MSILKNNFSLEILAKARMMHKFKTGIKHRVLLIALLPAIILSLILGTYFINIRMQSVQQGLINRGHAMSIRLASMAEYGIFAGDVIYLKDLTKKEFNRDSAKLSKELKSIVYYNKTGIEIYHFGNFNRKFILPQIDNKKGYYINNYKNFVSFIAPITIRNVLIDDNIDSEDYLYEEELNQTSIIGWIKLELDKQPAIELERKILFNSILIVIFGLVISGYLAIKIANRVVKPILVITNTVKKIQHGDLSAKVNANSHWELKSLEDGINSMAQSLQEAHTEMQKNIEQATADLRHTLETIEIQNIELEIARQEAENSSKIKSEFLASISHELRTPLNGTIGFLNILKKTDLSPKQKEYLNIIERSAKNLLSIISELLDLSKIEAGKLTIENIQMNLIDCIEDSLTLLAPSAHDKGIELVMNIAPDVTTQIISDPLRIKQLITNLVNNAIKFTERGSVFVNVMLDDNYQKERATIRINVSDTGIGLSKEEQNEIFKAFYRVGKSAKRISGTGLGLLICKKLINHMNGKIGVDSEPNEGSTFWLTLNVPTLENKQVIEPKLSGKKALVFEQHDLSCMSLCNILSSFGLEVYIAQSEETIIKELETKKYSAFILGINTPEKDKQLLENTVVKAREQFKDFINIIVCLNSTDYSIQDEILDIGADICLPKPIQNHSMLKALIEIITKPKNSITPHILIVDDNKENLKLLKVLLEDLGAETKEAFNGLEAISAVENDNFDLILMDIHMPKMDGIEATKHIRKLKKETPIIAVTAHAQAWEQNLLMKAGINDYLTKPIYEHELHNIINKWTDKKIKFKSKKAIDLINPEVKSSIDWELSKKLAGNKEDLARDMLDMLAKSLPKELAKITSYIEQKDYKNLKEVLHKLHGACCYCGVPNLKKTVKSFEIMLTERFEEKSVHFRFGLLKTEIQLVLDEFELMLSKL